MKNPDRVISMHYPAIHTSNQRPHHFIEGYIQHLEEKLRVTIPVHDLRPDLYVTENEKRNNPLKNLLGLDVPYWIIVSGGKSDFTAKLWGHDRYQKVVDALKDKILFVQVGEREHTHPPLEGVVNLVGRTTTRQLMNAVYHAQGVLCPVTFTMHLAAGMPCRSDRPPRRACVVIAGGREPPHWERYPWHRFLSNVGQLRCCAEGACWKAKVDGDCENPVGEPLIPRCLDMISPEEVVENIKSYFKDGWNHYLTREELGLLRGV